MLTAVFAGIIASVGFFIARAELGNDGPDEQFITGLPLVAETEGVFSFDPKTGGLRKLMLPPFIGESPEPISDGVVFAYGRLEGLIVSTSDDTRYVVEGMGPLADVSRDRKRALAIGQEISIIDFTSGKSSVLLDQRVWDAEWSPDEGRVAFIRDGQLGLLEIASGDIQMIAPEFWGADWSEEFGEDGLSELAWSPDGRFIAVLDGEAKDPSAPPDRDESGRIVPTTWPRWDIQLVELGTGSIRQLTDSEGSEGGLLFSPDGRYLSYAYSHELRATLELIDLDTHERRNLHVEDVPYAPPLWLDERTILVDNSSGIWTVRVDGSRQLLVANSDSCGGSLVASRDGRVVFRTGCKGPG